MLKYFYTILLVFVIVASKAEVFSLIVDSNGNGDHKTIQAAINAAPDNQSIRTLIFVLNGIYTEKVLVPATKVNISLIGESLEGVVISWNDYASTSTGLSSAETATLQVDGKDFYMENITVRNTAGRVGQALAIRTVGDRGVYKNCRFLGYQDTYYAHKARQYNYQCFVEGGTDFIYGDATAVFELSTINCVSGGSYITAPADTKLFTQFSSGNKFYNGLMMLQCEVTANTDVPDNSYYLGRPWQPAASSVYIKCKLGSHIKPEGWSTWNDDNHLKGYYGEYQSTSLKGDTIDVSQRVDWSYQISVDWIKNFYKLEFFLKNGTDVWDARTMTKALKTPENVQVDGDFIRWDKVDQAIGYVVYNKASFYKVTTEPLIDAAGLSLSDIQIKSVRENGVLSSVSNTNLLTGKNEIIPVNLPLVWVSNKTIFSNNNINVKLYNLGGIVVKSCQVSKELSLGELPSGPYILKATNEKGQTIVQKVML